MGAEQTKHISRRHTEQCGTNGGTGAGTNGATVYRLDGRSSDACVNPSYILAISVVVRLLPKAFCAPAAMAVLAAAYSRKLFYRIPVTLWHFQDTSRHICPCPPPTLVLSTISPSKNQLFLVLRGELLSKSSTNQSSLARSRVGGGVGSGCGGRAILWRL